MYDSPARRPCRCPGARLVAVSEGPTSTRSGCRKHAFAPRAISHPREQPLGHAKPARQRAFCPSHRRQLASGFSLADENPLDGTDPSGLSGESAYCKAHPTAGSCAPSVKAQAPLTKTQLAAAKAEGTALGVEEAAAKQLAADSIAEKKALEQCDTPDSASSSACGFGPQSWRAYANSVTKDTLALGNDAGALAGASANSLRSLGVPQSSSGGVSGLVVAGIVMGAVSVATGGLAMVADAAGSAAAGALATTSIVTGLAATAVDAEGCFGGGSGSTAACAGMGFGLASAFAAGAGVVLGNASEAAEGASAVTEGLSVTAFLGKLGNLTSAFVGFDATVLDTAEAYVNQH